MFDTKPTFEHIVTDLRETQDIKIIDNGTAMKEPSCKQHQSLSWIVIHAVENKKISAFSRGSIWSRLRSTWTRADIHTSGETGESVAAEGG
jgi:hypothetical protein